MGLKELIIPKGYQSKLSVFDTQVAIKLVKDHLETELAMQLNLRRVSAPLFVSGSSGLNDNLSGSEKPVSFLVDELNEEYEIVHSLAKWKRMALKSYGFTVGQGLYTDMNAIRKEENLDNLHSIYVDQWDWEKMISAEERNFNYLRETVDAIVRSLKKTEEKLCDRFSMFQPFIQEEVFYITTEELLQRYPDKTPKQREYQICLGKKTVFLGQIGGLLSDGTKHDHRSPDYDDWNLNGDIPIYNPILDCAFEISSMGIRVDEIALYEQLKKANCMERTLLPFHMKLLNHDLPLTIGGGIGQSRVCMLLLQKAHIGEVQVSAWSKSMIDFCKDNDIFLL